MLMVRELSEKEIDEVWHALDVADIIKHRPFWEWSDEIRMAFAKALFEAATVKQNEYEK